MAEFLEKDISGMHVYISPPFLSIEAVLKQYKTCKAKDPGNTSICILVPGWQSDIWRQFLKGFTLLKEFMPGNKVFETRNSGENQLKSVRYKIQAFYDRPDPPPPIGHSSKQGLKMTFACQVAGMPASMLVDTGSTESILKSQFANMAGKKVTACKNENKHLLA